MKRKKKKELKESIELIFKSFFNVIMMGGFGYLTYLFSLIHEECKSNLSLFLLIFLFFNFGIWFYFYFKVWSDNDKEVNKKWH